MNYTVGTISTVCYFLKGRFDISLEIDVLMDGGRAVLFQTLFGESHLSTAALG